MIIRKLIIEGLYGYLDKEINFYPAINILVGINGSGKTSVLNILNWLTTPDWPRLCTTPFHKLTLDLTLNEEKHRITCTQDSQQMILSSDTHYSDKPLVTKLHTPPSEIPPNRLSDYREAYRGVVPTAGEEDTWRFFQDIPKPTIIALDRHLLVEERDNLYVEDEPAWRPSRGRRRTTPGSPLERVRSIASEEYARYRQKLISLNNVLKDRLILSAFTTRESLDNDSALPERKQWSEETIRQLEDKVFRFLSQTSDSDAPFRNQRIKTVLKFFTDTRQALASKSIGSYYMSQVEPEDRLLTMDLDRIARMMEHFESFELEADKASQQIDNYIRLLNVFFSDSSKRLLFQEASNDLRYQVISRTGEALGTPREISGLSSGERQILVLLTYLTFQSGESEVFIIDEPELSLHPRWQEEFLPSLEKLMSPSTQLILATHSPDIVGNYKENCIVLLPYNQQ